MAQSNNVSAGQDATAQQHNNLRADIFSAHHQDPAGVKIVNADIADAAAIALAKLAALTANRALITNGAGLIIVSAVTVTELEYLAGLASKPVANSGNETINGIKTFGSIPVLPASDPSSDNQAVRKAYADSKFSVAKGGQTVLNWDAGETTKTIAHGLGKIPKKITFFFDDTQVSGTTVPVDYAHGCWTPYGQFSFSSYDQTIYRSSSTVGKLRGWNRSCEITCSADASNITLTISSDPNWSISIGVFWIAEA